MSAIPQHVASPDTSSCPPTRERLEVVPGLGGRWKAVASSRLLLPSLPAHLMGSGRQPIKRSLVCQPELEFASLWIPYGIDLAGPVGGVEGRAPK